MPHPLSYLQSVHQLLTQTTLITCNLQQEVLRADLRIQRGQITEIGPELPPNGAEVIPLRGAWLMPGFVQTHVHLCQTLFRGMADDLALLDWLRLRIWPLEAAYDEESLYWSARLGVSELLLGGTTAILDMGTVHNTNSIFQACFEAGIRAHIGRALMDRPNEAGLSQDREEAMTGACDEADRWHGRGRLHYAFAPRFVPSCSDELLREVATEARARGCLIHTHASENQDEVALVRELTGRDNILHLDSLGLSGPDVCLAHCIHLTNEEEQLLADTGTRVLHCPSSNLKLGSGIARVPELMSRGVHVSLGADGAPCNNRLDAFTEMRTAALIQKPRLNPTVMSAPTVLQMATRSGAEALGLPSGSLEVGRDADIVAVRPNHLQVYPSPNPISAVVYSMTPAAVTHVWIGGSPVVVNGQLLAWDLEETLRSVGEAARRVCTRARL